MGKFAQTVRVKATVDGDELTFACRPMTRVAALRMRGFQRVPVLDENGAQKIDKDNNPVSTLTDESLVKLVDEFAGHVDAVEGANDAAGAAIDKDTVLKSAFFIGALIQAAGAWAKESMPGN